MSEHIHEYIKALHLIINEGIHNVDQLVEKGCSRNTLNYLAQIDVLNVSGPDFYPKDAAFLMLQQSQLNKSIETFDKYSRESSQEMTKHTITMKKLTWWILGFTVVNVILLLIQLGVFK
jgi:hypothetical protein